MGYGGEAVASALTWLDTHTAHRQTRCIIDPQNLASMRIAARNGFVSLSRALYLNTEIEVFERLRPDLSV